MIVWIIAGILLIWLIFRRFSKEGKVEEYPLGLPRGSVRAFNTLLIISFPLGYLISGEPMPALITNAIFVLVAFYFQTRKEDEERFMFIVNTIEGPEKLNEFKTRKMPLYLPKYSVRTIIILLIILLFIGNTMMASEIPFEVKNTINDLLIIMFFFIIGNVFKNLGFFRKSEDIEEKVEKMKRDGNVTDFKILTTILDEKISQWKRKAKNLFSITILLTTITSLILYTIDFDLVIPFLNDVFDITLRSGLLLLVNVYYGFRD